MPLNHKIFLAQFDTIRRLADEGPCILVGRCADYVLRDHENLLNVFIRIASAEDRMKGSSSITGWIPPKFGGNPARKTDKQRAAYYNYYATGGWGDVNNYHLCLDSGVLGYDGCVDIIVRAVEVEERKDMGEGNMVRRGSHQAVLAGLAVLLVAAFGAADLAWQADTPGQQALRAYMDRVNVFLQEMGEQPVNSLFEMYKQLATFGITAREGADEPEGVEISVSLLYDAINSLVLRVNAPGRFPGIAAALIQALNPDTISRESALSVPQERRGRAAKNPQNSFEDPVEEL